MSFVACKRLLDVSFMCGRNFFSTEANLISLSYFCVFSGVNYKSSSDLAYLFSPGIHLAELLIVEWNSLRTSFSLHIRSMWETICDALHIPVARNFGSKFLECPYSSISGMLVWIIPPPPHENLGRSWHFEFELVWSTPPPPKMKIWADLGTLSLSWSGARMWRLIAVSPVDTISFSSVLELSVGTFSTLFRRYFGNLWKFGHLGFD